MLLAQALVDGEVAVLVGVGVLLDLLPHDGGGADGGKVVGRHLHAAPAAPRRLHTASHRGGASETSNVLIIYLFID